MNILYLAPGQKETRRRILELTYRSKLPHLGSCLSVVDIIDAIYQVKRKDEHFVLSGGHAAIALYVILEKKHFIDQKISEKLHIHPDRNIDFGIDVSTGSLGQGLPISLGMAFADKDKRVFCVITDGECAEGSIWESLRIVYEAKINNLITVVNVNGWGAYDPILSDSLLKRIKGFGLKTIEVCGHDINRISGALEKAARIGPSVVFAKTTVEQFNFLKGQDAHYYVMKESDYKIAMESLR